MEAMEIRPGTGARPRSRPVWAIVKLDTCSAASAVGTCEASQMSDCAKTLTGGGGQCVVVGVWG